MLTITQALKEGYTVDTTVYPHFAYKGPRFAPPHHAPCLTNLEAELLIALKEVAFLFNHETAPTEVCRAYELIQRIGDSR